MSDIRRVSAPEAAELLAQGYQYVDVRTEGEYAAGHPKGAHNVPFMLAANPGMKPNPEFLKLMEARYPKDQKLVVGCQAGGRSFKACQALAAAGYGDVVDVRPGYGGVRNAFGRVTEPGWAASNLPIEP
jgi:rhodanese-related sulfurtransferase